MKRETSKWLNNKFLDLQKGSGRRWTLTEFAEYLDCPQPQVSRWLMGKTLPGSDYIEKIAKLGDEIYDLVDLPRPDPDLRYIEQHWEFAPASIRKAARRIIEEALGRDEQRSKAPARSVAASNKA